ncbi:MAG: hypothetical protein ACE5H4_01780 [Candidatus Thorarchaeota archaeon]
MEVDGGEISLAFSGRTRDSGFDLISNRSDLVTTLFVLGKPFASRRISPIHTRRGSPPKTEYLSRILRVGYIAIKS